MLCHHLEPVVPFYYRFRAAFSRLQKIFATALCRYRLFACSIFLLSLRTFAQELPGGSVLEARLSSATGSRISHRGDPIEATIIAPISVQGRILIPQGSRLVGFIKNATAIGLGLKHSSASVAYAFDALQLPDGRTVPVTTELVEVETAKEQVDDHGIVRGIHPIASLSSGVSFYAVPLLFLDPVLGAPVWCMKSIIAPSANPEIYFPIGTEIILRLTNAVTVPAPNTDSVPLGAFSHSDATEIEHLQNASAQRAYMGTRPSDAVNVLLFASRQQIDRAFDASGWTEAQPKSPLSLYRMYYALTRRNGYPRAPMNRLTLNGIPSAFVHQKSLDTISKRHHMRFWQYPGRANVWLGTAAEDTGLRFEITHWTHSTDADIDTERAKVVGDLAFTGCVDAAGLLLRASSEIVQDPKAKRPIVTDGKVAVIRLNDCLHPHLMPGVTETSALHRRRRLALVLSAFRDDVVRSNIFFTMCNTLKWARTHRSGPPTVHSSVVHAGPRGLDWLVPITRAKSTGDGHY
jgi:hypothetical protein